MHLNLDFYILGFIKAEHICKWKYFKPQPFAHHNGFLKSHYNKTH